MDCSSEAYSSIHHEPQDIYEVVEVIEEETDYVEEIAQMEEDHTEHIDVDTDGYTHIVKTEEHGYAQGDETEGHGYMIVAETDADEYTEVTQTDTAECTRVVQTEGRKTFWTKPATKLMLCLLEDILPDVGTSEELRNKSEMWKLIAEEMRKDGYSFSPIQVENKFRSVERQYKKTALTKNGLLSTMTTRSSTKQIETKHLTNEQKSDAEVVWVHSDETNMQVKDETTVSEVEADFEPKADLTTEEDLPSASAKHKTTASSRQVQKTFAKMAMERKKYHDKILEFLKKKEERARKREERDCKKLELLELLLKEKS